MAKLKIVYVITEREGKSFWNRIGVAFENSDGSLNVKLESLPVNGEMHIRDYVGRASDGPHPATRGGRRTPPEDGGPGPDGPHDEGFPF